MTREEAISELQYAQAMCKFNLSTGKFEFCNDKDRKQYEAFGIAIEALKREDTILKEIERVVLYGERSEANG